MKIISGATRGTTRRRTGSWWRSAWPARRMLRSTAALTSRRWKQAEAVLGLPGWTLSQPWRLQRRREGREKEKVRRELLLRRSDGRKRKWRLIQALYYRPCITGNWCWTTRIEPQNTLAKLLQRYECKDLNFVLPKSKMVLASRVRNIEWVLPLSVTLYTFSQFRIQRNLHIFKDLNWKIQNKQSGIFQYSFKYSNLKHVIGSFGLYLINTWI